MCYGLHISSFLQKQIHILPTSLYPDLLVETILAQLMATCLNPWVYLFTDGNMFESLGLSVC